MSSDTPVWIEAIASACAFGVITVQLGLETRRRRNDIAALRKEATDRNEASARGVAILLYTAGGVGQPRMIEPGHGVEIRVTNGSGEAIRHVAPLHSEPVLDDAGIPSFTWIRTAPISEGVLLPGQTAVFKGRLSALSPEWVRVDADVVAEIRHYIGWLDVRGVYWLGTPAGDVWREATAPPPSEHATVHSTRRNPNTPRPIVVLTEPPRSQPPTA